MKLFTELFERLDGTTSTLAKVKAMADYFDAAPAADAAWAVFFLSGRRFKRLVAPGKLRPWALEATGLPEWLFEDCYSNVGDLAETLALLVADENAPPTPLSDLPLHVWIEEKIEPLRGLDEEAQRAQILGWFRVLPRGPLFILAKLLTGGLRVGVSRTLTVRALAQAANQRAAEEAAANDREKEERASAANEQQEEQNDGADAGQAAGKKGTGETRRSAKKAEPPKIETATLHHRLMGHWRPSAEQYTALLDFEQTDTDASRPYPFFLAAPIDGEPADLGPVEEWQAEWKWDGIRGQLIRRRGETFLWSRGEELVTERYPEIVETSNQLPDGTVLDGEILAWRDGEPLPFAVLQKRIGRKRPGKKSLSEAPVTFLTYDLLEHGDEDWRPRPLDERRARLEATVEGLFPTSPRVEASSWDDLAEMRSTARERQVEGLMLKRRSSAYGTGRRKGDWWKWKVEPLTLDAVLIYAQAGHGKRATLLTDYTFAVWKGDTLVPIAKAYSGLDQSEIFALDRWLRRNTLERFGPVRSVRAEQVFELGFEGIRASSRHKSGLAVRFPRILRWRKDLGPEDADTLEQVRALLG